MNLTVTRLILAATFLGQLAFVFLLHSNSENYRTTVRDEAYKAYILSDTPKNRVVWDSEYRLQQKRQTLCEAIWITGLFINGLFCCKFCNLGIINPGGRTLISACAGGLIVFGIAVNCPGNLEPALFWSMPLFHKFFPPLSSGPNPVAGLLASATNVFILASITFVFLSMARREPKQPGHPTS